MSQNKINVERAVLKSPFLNRVFTYAPVFFYPIGLIWLVYRLASGWLDLAKLAGKRFDWINIGFLAPLVLLLLVIAGLLIVPRLPRFTRFRLKLRVPLVICLIAITVLLGGLYILASLSRVGGLPSTLWQRVLLINEYIYPTTLGASSETFNLPEILSGQQEPSPARLLENGQPLGPANMSLASISKIGLGQFDFEGDHLYLSTSDNTDPRINGRAYSIEAPLFLAYPDVEWLLLVLAIATLVLTNLVLAQGEEEKNAIAKISGHLSSWPVIRSISQLRNKAEAAFSGSHYLSYMVRALALGLAIFAFIEVCFATLSPAIVSVFISNKGLQLIFVSIIIILYIAYSAKGWSGALIALTVTLLLYSLQLAAVWNSAHTDGSLIGGLLPWSDASDYYWGAQGMSQGMFGVFSNAFLGRRPWFTGFLGVILGVTQNNLQWTLLVLVFITAVASFLLAREIQRDYGTIAAAVTQLIVFVFYQRFVGETLTENLGLAMGLIALAVLWRGAKQRRVGLVSLGIALLGLALVARAGAFFVLPTLVVWATWTFRRSTKRLLCLLPAAAVVLIFGLDIVFRVLLAGSSSGAFSNFSTVLYGIAVGNKGWTQIYIDHPEVQTLPSDQAANDEIYRLTFEAIRQDPMTALKGVLSTWKDYFDPRPFNQGAFSFINISSVLLWFVFGICLIACIQRRHEPEYGMMIVICLGILLSIPLVPPIDSDSMRAYAATIPVFAVFIGIGTSIGIRAVSLASLRSQEKYSSVRYRDLPLISNTPALGAAFVACCFLFPIGSKIITHPIQLQDTPCASGSATLYFANLTTPSLQLVADDARAQTKVPEVRLSDFRAELENLSEYPELVQLLGRLNAGTSLNYSFSLNGGYYWLIGDTQLLNTDTRKLKVCARLVDDSKFASDYHFYQVEGVTPLP